MSDHPMELARVLHELWLSEFAWKSMDVFAPIYDLICEMMALYGMAFARHGDEWRIVMSDEASGTIALRDFLLSEAKGHRRSPMTLLAVRFPRI